MDCRRTLLWGLGLLAGCAGCLNQGRMPAGVGDPPPNVKKEADLPKRQPKPATCVAFGNFREREAADDKLAPAARQECWEQARKAYQQALAIDATYLPAYLALAHLYITLEDYPRALATYDKALKKHPGAAEVWHALGMCHARKKEWEPALAALKKATELEPENRQYARALGLCLARAGRTDEAAACLTKLSNPAEAYYTVARMLHHLRRDDESKRWARAALEAKPDLTEARDFLAYLDHPDAPAGGLVAVGFEEEPGNLPPAPPR
jgi:tetratricopeptide (TPR) repeat protein